MTINTEHIRATMLADASELGVTDTDSMMILAIGRIAQAALADEVERLVAGGADEAELAAYREERTEELNRWLAMQAERVRMRAVAREGVDRCMA